VFLNVGFRYNYWHVSRKRRIDFLGAGGPAAPAGQPDCVLEVLSCSAQGSPRGSRAGYSSVHERTK